MSDSDMRICLICENKLNEDEVVVVKKKKKHSSPVVVHKMTES